MKEAKDEYYRFKKIADESFGGLVKEVTNYITALEGKVKNQKKEINLKHLTPKQK